MKLINCNKIVSIETEDFTESTSYVYKKEKRNIFNKIVQKEGFYSIADEKYLEKLPDSLSFNEHTYRVYYKPTLTLFIDDDIEFTFYFETLDEAEKMAETVSKYNGWLDIHRLHEILM